MDHTTEYCCAVRRDLAELMGQINRGERILFSDGIYRRSRKDRIDLLIIEYARVGDVMRQSVPGRGDA